MSPLEVHYDFLRCSGVRYQNNPFLLTSLVGLTLNLMLLVDIGAAQRLKPFGNLRSQTPVTPVAPDTSRFLHHFSLDQTPAPTLEFVLIPGDLVVGLMNADQFRQFQKSIAHSRFRRPNSQSGWSPRIEPRSESSEVGQVAYWQDVIHGPSGGDASDAAVEPEEGRPNSTTDVDTETDAANSNIGPTTAPNQIVGPAVYDGNRLKVPISEQEIGQLNEQILEQAKAAENETGEEQKRHLSLLDDARKALAQANKLMWKDIKQQNKAKNFELEKERLATQLEQTRKQQQPAAGTSADELFEELEQLRSELAIRNERLREINQSGLQQKKRMEKIPALRTKAKADLADNRKQTSDQENGEANAFDLVLLRAKALELEYSIKALSSESKLHELENRLLPIRGDDLTREIKLLEAEIDAWNFAANEQRRKDIAQEVRQAQLAAIEAAPALKSLADTNAKLTQRRAESAEKIRQASEEDLNIQSKLNGVKNLHENAEKEIVGNTFNEANGIRLVEIRRQLPTPFHSQARISEIESELRKISLAQLELNERRRPLAHPREYVDQKLAGVVSETLSPEELRKTALDFVDNIRSQYDQLSSDHHDYSELLRKIVSERKELVDEIHSTQKFVDEQTLWIQSAKSFGLDHLAKTQHGAREFFDPSKWYDLLDSLTARLFRRPHESAAALIGLVGLFAFSRRFKG